MRNVIVESKNKCAVVASDVHCLSKVGLLRPGFKTIEGNEIGLNPVQEWLWEQFESCIDEVEALRNGDDFSLILNGDLIEGNHHRTKEILACDEAEHARAAIYSLKPLTSKASEVYITEGTECHTKEFENYIGGELGAVKSHKGASVFETLLIEFHGCLGEAQHHMPTTSRKYLEASQLSIQIGNSQLTYARHGHRVPKWFARGHRHVHGLYSDGNAMMFVSPAWQDRTRHARKVVTAAVLTPGFVWLDWRNKAEGELPAVDMILRSPKE